MDSVRFTGPTKIGDTIRCEVEIESMEAKDEQQGVISAKNSIKNQRGEDLVVYTTKILCGRRPKA
jgi:acyl dehydratase